jgi:thiamine biosynthesis protein ThiI
MYRVACAIAEKLHALGLVTEETLEKDSPTLLNLSTVDEAARLPVHRPLIGLDRAEIQTLASRIGISQLLTREEHAYIDGPLALAELQKLRAIEQDLEVDNLVQGIVGKARKIDLS